MGFFNATIAAATAGRTVRASLLVFFDFVDEPTRLWMGQGTLVAGGQEWKGLGEWGSVDGLEQAIGTVAPQTTFKLSGVSPEIVTLARQSSDRVKGRNVNVYTQFFDEQWAPLDQPYVVWSGILDLMKYAATGPSERSVTVTAEGLWTARRRPVYSLYTDRDQKARFPGDRGLEEVPDLVTKSIIWPKYS